MTNDATPPTSTIGAVAEAHLRAHAPSSHILTTDRLVLDALCAADAPAFFAYRSDPAVSAYQSFDPSELEEAIRFIDGLGDTPFGTPDTWFQMAVRLRDSGHLIGDLGVHFVGEGAQQQVEIGFTIAPAHQSKGLATEAVRALLDHLFEARQTHRVVASVDPQNTASVALLERLGFRREGLFVQSLWFKGVWVDDLVFGLLRTDPTG